MKLLPDELEDRVRYLRRLTNVLDDHDLELNEFWVREIVTMLINELRVAWSQIQLLEQLDEQGRTE